MRAFYTLQLTLAVNLEMKLLDSLTFETARNVAIFVSNSTTRMVYWEGGQTSLSLSEGGGVKKVSAVQKNKPAPLQKWVRVLNLGWHIGGTSSI